MRRCVHVDKNKLRCQNLCLSAPDKTIPSEYVSVGENGEFIYLHTERYPISKYCYYHNKAIVAANHQQDVKVRKGIIAQIEKTQTIKGY